MIEKETVLVVLSLILIFARLALFIIYDIGLVISAPNYDNIMLLVAGTAVISTLTVNYIQTALKWSNE